MEEKLFKTQSNDGDSNISNEIRCSANPAIFPVISMKLSVSLKLLSSSLVHSFCVFICHSEESMGTQFLPSKIHVCLSCSFFVSKNSRRPIICRIFCTVVISCS